MNSNVLELIQQPAPDESANDQNVDQKPKVFLAREAHLGPASAPKKHGEKASHGDHHSVGVNPNLAEVQQDWVHGRQELLYDFKRHPELPEFVGSGRPKPTDFGSLGRPTA